MKPAMDTETYNKRWLSRVREIADRTPTGCLVSRASKARNGYPQTNYRGRTIRIHRQLYQLVHSVQVPATMDICHTCDNRGCIEITHLWVGTRKENVDDMTAKARHWSKVKTHCKHGHEFTPENTEIRQSRGKPGQGRACKTCGRIRRRMVAGWTREEAESLERIPSGYNRFGVAVMKVSIHSVR